jgi:hypothetical protein
LRRCRQQIPDQVAFYWCRSTAFCQPSACPLVHFSRTQRATGKSCRLKCKGIGIYRLMCVEATASIVIAVVDVLVRDLVDLFGSSKDTSIALQVPLDAFPKAGRSTVRPRQARRAGLILGMGFAPTAHGLGLPKRLDHAGPITFFLRSCPDHLSP